VSAVARTLDATAEQQRREEAAAILALQELQATAADEVSAVCETEAAVAAQHRAAAAALQEAHGLEFETHARALAARLAAPGLWTLVQAVLEISLLW
jgi:hypothetical protein